MRSARESGTSWLGMAFKTLCRRLVSPAMAPGSIAMQQQDFGLSLSQRCTRKAVCPGELSLVAPWLALLVLISQPTPRAKTGCPTFELV